MSGWNPGGLEKQRRVQNRQIRRRVRDRIENGFGILEYPNVRIDINRNARRSDAGQMRSRGLLQGHRLAVLLRAFRLGLFRRLFAFVAVAAIALRAWKHKKLLAGNTSAPKIARHQEQRSKRVGDGAKHNRLYQDSGKVSPSKLNRRQHLRRLLIERPADRQEALDAGQVRPPFNRADLRDA